MNITLAAGGTGGHMVPAHALAAELKSRGHGVMLVTDDRGAKIPGLFEDVPTHILPAGRLGGGPIGMIKRAWSLSQGHWWRLFGFVLLFGIAAIVLLGAVGDRRHGSARLDREIALARRRG